MPLDFGIIDQVWVPVVLFATLAVFIGDLLANIVFFSNRLGNAVALAVIAGVAVFGFGVFYDGRPAGELMVPSLICAAIGLVVGYLGNVIAFGNRFINALVTAILFGVLCVGGIYVSTTMIS